MSSVRSAPKMWFRPSHPCFATGVSQPSSAQAIGPEFIAKTVKQWLEASEVKTLYIEPGSPWENAYSETFISRFSDELLKREVFADRLEAKVLVEDYRGHYNHQRPHSALGYRTPAEFAMAVGLYRKVEDAGMPGSQRS
jgi:transposase InsO family protein